MTHFFDRSIRRPSSVPMHRVITFAIISTRRQEEINRITWADLDKEGKRVLLRDMKNAGEKIGMTSAATCQIRHWRSLRR